MEIRPCSADDFDEVFGLLKQLWPDRTLDSAFHRTEAHAFYEKHGFERHGYLFSRML